MREWDSLLYLSQKWRQGRKRKGESCPFSQSELLSAFWKGEGPASGSLLVEVPCHSEGSPGDKQPGYTSNWLFWKSPDEGSIGGGGVVTCPC